MTAAKDVIEKLTWIAPVYYVTGNHEARTGEYYALSAKMRSLGVKELKDEAITKRFHGDHIVILGLEDPMGSKARGTTEKADTQKRLSSIAFDHNEYSVLLSHRPELLDVYAAEGVDLVFAGHAHGGLIRLPFILDNLIGIIRTEKRTLKPKDAANLTEDELLAQMSILKKQKK